MPNSRSEAPLRGSVENRNSETAVGSDKKPKGRFKQLLEGGFDQILLHSRLNRSYRICGCTFQSIGLLYATFFLLFMMVSKLFI